MGKGVIGNFGGVVYSAAAGSDSGPIFSAGPAQPAGPGSFMPDWPYDWHTFQWQFVPLSSTGCSCTIYGTSDIKTANGTRTGANANWFKIPGPSEQSGTGSIANPISATVPLLIAKGIFICAFRIVEGGAGAAGTFNVLWSAGP